MDFSLDRKYQLVSLNFTEPFEPEDFEHLGQVLTPFIEDGGDIKGLLLEANAFSQWMKVIQAVCMPEFIQLLNKGLYIALVTDDVIDTALLAQHFNAEPRQFSYTDKDSALSWLIGLSR